MRLLRKKGYDEILDRIWSSANMSEDLEPDLTALREDFDNRDTVLRQLDEGYSAESEDSDYEWEERDFTSTSTSTEPTEDWEQKYNDLAARYRSRFFGKVSENIVDREDVTVEEIIESQTEDTKSDARPKTYADLLYGASKQ